jgi:hypothetical protein
MSGFLKFGFISLLFELAVLGQINLGDSNYMLLDQDSTEMTKDWSVRAISNDLEKSFEFVEVPNSNENSEEDEKLKNQDPGAAHFLTGSYGFEKNKLNCQSPFIDELLNRPSLIILYHSWKFHLSC